MYDILQQFSIYEAATPAHLHNLTRDLSQNCGNSDLILRNELYTQITWLFDMRHTFPRIKMTDGAELYSWIMLNTASDIYLGFNYLPQFMKIDYISASSDSLVTINWAKLHHLWLATI